MPKSPPRLSQVLTPEQHQKLKENIPDGVRRKFFSIVIDDLIEAFEGPHGEHILGAVLSRRLRPRNLIKSLPEQVNGRSA